MSDDNTDQQQQRTPVELVHKQLAFSFIRVLRSLDVDSRATSTAVSALSDAFQIDPAGFDGMHDTKVDLVSTFKDAVAKSAEIDPRDEKFVAFIELLSKKGYFNGAPEGTDEYKARLQKAEAKFRAKSNPYEGLNAEQLKEKGNELMQKAHYREAVGFYTRAVELNPENHVYFANRAAAFIHLRDYVSAINDGERSVAINPKYPKAFSRLGNAHYFEGNYQRAVDAYTRALELDPENETYKTELERAKEKVAAMPAGGGGMGGAGGAGGFPGFGGMDVNQMMGMMNNPGFQEMAGNMMKNPNFMNMVQGMAGNLGMQAPSMDQLEGFLKSGPPKVDDSGNFETPFGKMNKEALEKLRAEHAANPKMKAIMEDVQTNGPASMHKYLGDPEVMSAIQNMMSSVRPDGAGGAASGGSEIGAPPQ